MVVLKKVLKKVMPKRFGKHLNISQDMDSISLTQLAILYLAFSVPISLPIILSSGWLHSLTKNQKDEKNKQSTSFEAWGIE